MPKLTVILLLVLVQILTTAGDFFTRKYLKVEGFGVAQLSAWWFWAFVVIKIFTNGIWLTMLTQVELGRLSALFGVCSLITANIISIMFLGDILKPTQYIGVGFAVLALIFLMI